MIVSADFPLNTIICFQFVQPARTRDVLFMGQTSCHCATNAAYLIKQMVPMFTLMAAGQKAIHVQ